MSLPTIEPLPDDNPTLPPARRRRQRRMVLPEEGGERAEFLHSLSRRTIPSFDFFLFSLLAGLMLGVALLLDSPALVLLSALLAPFMAPAVGISLGTITGTGRFVLQALGSLSIGSLIVFLCGTVAGWVVYLLPPQVYQQAAYHSQFTWPDFLVLLLSAGLTTYLLVRAPHQKPQVTSVAIAYSLYLPIGVAGFGLSSGLSAFWPSALILFFVHLIFAALAGMIVLILLGLRPLNAKAFLFGGTYIVFGLLAAAAIYNPQAALPYITKMIPQSVSGSYVGGANAGGPNSGNAIPNNPVSAVEASQTPTPAPSSTPVPATRTPTPSATPTHTLVPTRTPTLTVSPAPTPIWARINASQGDGALVRAEPDYNAKVVQSLLNGTLVEVLPEVTSNTGATWVHIRIVNDKEGWVVRSLLRTATPAPNW